MIYEFPDDTQGFRCIAGRCADTCCAGWEVDIDEETAAWYASVPGAFGRRLKNAMAVSPEDESVCFPPGKDGRCPFLDGRNLCEIYSHLGEAALSRVCTEYPRYYVRIGDYEQIDMSLSCMEYGRIFFAAGARKLMRAEDDLEGTDGEEIDNERLLQILDFRDWAVDYMQNGSGRWDARLRAVETEGLAAFGDSDAGSDSSVCLSGKDASGAMLPELALEHSGCRFGEESDASLIKRVASLELIDDRWKETEKSVAAYAASCTGNTQSSAERKTSGCVRASLRTEKAAPKEVDSRKNEEAWLTKLAVYFLFRYTIDIWYDGNADSVFRLVNRSLRYLQLMAGAEEKRLGRGLEAGDIVDLAHRYSKQVEHSEENVAVMKER